MVEEGGASLVAVDTILCAGKPVVVGYFNLRSQRKENEQMFCMAGTHKHRKMRFLYFTFVGYVSHTLFSF